MNGSFASVNEGVLVSVDVVPSAEQFRPVVLAVLVDGKPRQVREIYQLAADCVSLSATAREQRTPSGELRYNTNVGWACSGLIKAGLLRRPARGIYEITPDGVAVEARRLASYSEKDMEEWPDWRDYLQEIRERRSADSTSDVVPVQGLTVETVGDPTEGLEATAEEYNDGVETDLRRRLQESPPEFFEKAVLDLLWKMGFGGVHGDKKHVGRTGDGGIDGVISQDALGLRKLCVQAKRYKDGSNVGAGEIRDFYGALKLQRAERGVFITTAKFTPDAVKSAHSFNDEIVLIDGIKLTALMLEYGIGVETAKNLTLYRVDEDFFNFDQP